MISDIPAFTARIVAGDSIASIISRANRPFTPAELYTAIVKVCPEVTPRKIAYILRTKFSSHKITRGVYARSDKESALFKAIMLDNNTEKMPAFRAGYFDGTYNHRTQALSHGSYCEITRYDVGWNTYLRKCPHTSKVNPYGAIIEFMSYSELWVHSGGDNAQYPPIVIQAWHGKSYRDHPHIISGILRRYRLFYYAYNLGQRAAARRLRLEYYRAHGSRLV